MRIATSEDGKSITRIKTAPTPTDNFEEGIKLFKQTADELTNSGKVEAVAGGVALVFNHDRSLSISTSNMHGWVNKPFKKTLTDLFQAPVFVENDTAVVGLGEATAGAGKDKKIVAYITVSTGLGGARIVDGKIDHTSLGFEPGHQIIVIDGKDCHCGGKGHLEAYVAGGYDQTDWSEVEKYLAVGLNNIIVHWSPEIVILGGAVMNSLSLENVRRYLDEKLTIFPTSPEITLAELDDKDGLHGALALIHSQDPSA